MKTKKPQRLEVEQPFGMDPPNVHCLLCGEKIVDEEGSEFTPCGHLLFTYIGMIGDFDYRNDDFEGRVAEVDTEDVSFDTLPDFLHGLGYDSRVFLLEITYGGMACGPSWYTDVYGFTFSPEPQKETAAGGSPKYGSPA